MAKKRLLRDSGRGSDGLRGDLKKAFRRPAMKYHPDRNTEDPEAEQRFKEAKEAYEILSDPQKRSAYDQFGHAGVDPSIRYGRWRRRWRFWRHLWRYLRRHLRWWSAAWRQRPRRGPSIHAGAFTGRSGAGNGIADPVPTQIRCETCSGSGAKPGTSPTPCKTCNGQGQVRMQQGFSRFSRHVRTVEGKGTIVSSPCGDCHGAGTVQKQNPAGQGSGGCR